MSSPNMRTARAVIWFTRLQEGSMTERRMYRLERWLAVPANRREFESARAAWNNTPSTEQAERLMGRSGSRTSMQAIEFAPAPTTRSTFSGRGAQCAAVAEPICDRARVVIQEAAYWFIRCRDEASMSRPDRREFVQWLRQSADNVAELFKMMRLDGGLCRHMSARRSRELSKSNVVELATARSPHRPHRESGPPAESRDPGEVKNKRAFSHNMAAVAATILFGTPLVFVAQHYSSSRQVVTTGASQWHRMMLTDGTVVDIDARSRVEVEYTEQTRMVHLYEGSAVFDVAKDPRRPFIVRTDLIDVVAVGTRFGVAMDAGVTTTVAEGVVRVTGRGRSESLAITLKAGEELHVPDSTVASPRSAHVDAERKLQWARNRLINLGGLTIFEGVEQLNRRNRTQIVVESPTLGAKVVEAANIRVDSPETYARIVAAEPGVTMTVDKDKHLIRLSE